MLGWGLGEISPLERCSISWGESKYSLDEGVVDSNASSLIEGRLSTGVTEVSGGTRSHGITNFLVKGHQTEKMSLTEELDAFAHTKWAFC